jgi:predicted small secreted protein
MIASMLRTLLVVSGIGFAAAGLSACYTTEGVGKDIEAAGGAVEEKAEETRPY